MAGKRALQTIIMGLAFAAQMCVAQERADSSDRGQPADSQHVTVPISAPAIPSASAPSDLKSRLSLFAALDEGQAMRGVYPIKNTAFPRTWQEDMIFHLTDEITYQERLKFIASIEAELLYSFAQDNQYPATLTTAYNFYPNDVEVSYAFGNVERPWLQLAAGYFPFKYNPDAKNLGEYLLRDIAYPTVIKTGFEFAFTRELGFHASGIVGNPSIDQAKWDLMLTSETNEWPLQDWTVTAVASNNLLNFFDVGAGVSFQRLLSVNESKTTPQIPADSFLNSSGNTSHYTFRSTKLMGRAAVSPLAFVPEFRIPPGFVFGDKPFFSREDFRVYGEIAVLGLDNQVAYVWDTTGTGAGGPRHLVEAPKEVNYYDSLGDRMPFMVGIDLPTNPLISYGILPFLLTKWLKDETGDDIRPLAFVTLVPALASGVLSHYLGCNIGLDVLSFEVEYYSNRYPNSDYNPLYFTGGNVPLPYPNSIYMNNYAEGKPMPYKYSLYFKKTFLNQRFAFSGQIARDHMRPPYLGQLINGVTDDFLLAKNQWWWTLRLSANF
jgi:hypothetical protein